MTVDKKNLRRVTITVTAQTLHHMTTQAGGNDRRALGRVVDNMTRENRLTETNQRPARRARKERMN